MSADWSEDMIEDWDAIEEEIALTCGPDWRNLSIVRLAFQTGYPESVIEIARERPPR